MKPYDKFLTSVQVATIAWLEADSVCGSHSVTIPIALVLPYIFRLFQCLRQYKDTREKTSLLNGKLTSLPFSEKPMDTSQIWTCSSCEITNYLIKLC